MNETTVSITHAGIKGMQWGVRKKSDGSHLSTPDLKAAIERMNLQKQYSALIKGSSEPRITQKGAKVVAELLGGVAKVAVATVLTKKLVSVLDSAING